MDTRTFAKDAPTVAMVGTSRLPAGSTLEVNGIHVPHPHAEVNLAGAGDPRLGDTDAVTETLDGEVKPLADEVKPRRMTTDKDAPKVDPILDAASDSTSDGKLELKQDSVDKVAEQSGS